MEDGFVVCLTETLLTGYVLPTKSGAYSNKHPLPALTHVGRQQPPRVGRTRTDSDHEQPAATTA